jgi:hypothetical protein
VNYSFDTSALIEAWNRHYPPDVFDAVWAHLDKLIDHKKLQAIDEVRRELEDQGDELWTWAKARKKMFVPLDSSVQRRAARILRDFPALAKPGHTRRDADPFVIALAAENGLTVVTYEQSKPTKPRIPDVCRSLEISCFSLVEVFRQEGWTF